MLAVSPALDVEKWEKVVENLFYGLLTVDNPSKKINLDYPYLSLTDYIYT